jgi:hypothetical protein
MQKTKTNESDDFIMYLCDELIENLDTFAKIIEWDYPIEYGVDCEKVIDHINEIKKDYQK